MVGFRKYTAGDDGTLAAVDTAVYKEFYLPGVRDVINSQRILSAMMSRDSESIQGRYAVGSLNVERNESSQYIGEDGYLPEPDKQGYAEFKYRTRFNYNRIQITGPSASASRGDRGSYIRVQDAEISAAARDIQHENNRVLFGNQSGTMALTNGATGGTVIQLDNPGGFTNSGPGTQFIRKKMRVAFVSTDGNTWYANASGGYTGLVTSVDRASGTITVDNQGSGTAVSWAGLPDNTRVVRVSRHGATAPLMKDTSLFNEMHGLASMVGVGNIENMPSALDRNKLGGIDATVEELWNSAVIENAGVPIAFDTDMLQRGEEQLAQISGYMHDAWIGSYGIRRQYINSLLSQKRYPNTMSLDGGWEAVEYNGRPIVVDKDATRGRLYGLTFANLKMFMETDYNWMDADGSILTRVPNKDAYEATLYRYAATGTDARNRHILIKDIIDQ